jgi:adenylate cyclase class 2
MMLRNIEVKTKCSDFTKIRGILQANNASFIGIDHQIDTYFQTTSGRLKLRKATLPSESGLIRYERENKSGPKFSKITVFQTPNENVLSQILLESFNTLVAVRKRREIFVIDNVKFHLDTVEKLGNFLEIEAQDSQGFLGKKILLKQCRYFMNLLQIEKRDLIAASYSDLLLHRNHKSK